MVAAAQNTERDTDLQFLMVPVDNIEPDADQPRKTFVESELAQLTDSVRVHGVVVPIALRPHPKKGVGAFVLVDGERRWRAAKRAKLEYIPAVIDDLDDGEVLERQIIANSQRVDVPPLEEGAAYQRLLDDHEYTMDKLVEKTGRSRAHLYGRIRLTKLPAYVKKALGEGRLQGAIAELATRIHDAKLQERYIKECLGDVDNYQAFQEAGVSSESLREEDKPHARGEVSPLSFRAALQLLRRRYMLRLELAKFDPADAELVAKAGACTSCPKRSGNQPELPGLTNGAKGDDLCTDPGCFEDKTQAQWKQAAAAAKASDVEVVDQKKAKDFFDWRDEINWNAPVVAPNTELPHNLRKPGTSATYGKLLGKEIANVKKVLVQDPSGAPIEVLDKEDAIKKLRELGKIDDGRKKAKSPKERAEAKAEKQARAKEKDKRELAATAGRVFLGHIAAAAEKLNEKKELAFLRLVARSCAEHCDFGADEMVVERRGLKATADISDALVKEADALKSAGEVRALLAEIVVANVVEAQVSGHLHGARKELFNDACKIFGVDWAKALAAAREVAKAEEKADAAKEKKKGGK